MRSTKSSTNSGQSLKILLFFCASVLILIFLASALKIVAVIAKSSFDGNHRFTVAYIGKPMHILSFAPDAKTISIVEIEAAKPYKKEELAVRMRIPVDAYITKKGDSQTFQGEDPKSILDSYLQNLFFSFHNSSSDMTLIDVFRLWMFTKSVEPTNVFQEMLQKPLETIESGAVDKTAATYFSDVTFSEENKSIQVINGTGIAGVGNDFAQILTNIGGNVISVTTSPNETDKTTISYAVSEHAKPSYTVTKLEKLLKVKGSQWNKPRMFDIIVTIGKDRIDLLKK